jgi:hypothetical protein
MEGNSCAVALAALPASPHLFAGPLSCCLVAALHAFHPLLQEYQDAGAG